MRTYILSKNENDQIEFKANNNSYALVQHNKHNYRIIVLSSPHLLNLYNAIVKEMELPIYDIYGPDD